MKAAAAITLFQERVGATGTAVLATGLAVLLATLCLHLCSRQSSEGDATCAPLASPHVPIFGNALEYKKGPAKFLIATAAKCGPVFRLNLAGMHTTVVCSAETMKQFAFAPTSVLSAKAAVADLGFDYTLGRFNVSQGTDIHKRIIKTNYFTTAQLEKSASLLRQYIESSIKHELDVLGSPVIPDFMAFVRKVVLSAMIGEMLGSSLSEQYGSLGPGFSLVDDFIVLQDGIEDATAKAAVLPAWLAGPACLWTAATRRGRMVRRLHKCLEAIWAEPVDVNIHGVWLRELRSADSKNELSLENTAELIVGLLFAAHKNAAIAAAQTILFLLEEKESSGRGTELFGVVASEAMAFAAAATSSGASVLEALSACEVTSKCVRETLRTTAHTIGAMRKVVHPDGWSVTAATAAGQVRYTVPFGSYVGASHIVPNVDASSWGKVGQAFDPLNKDVSANFDDDLIFTTFSHGVHKCPGSRIAMIVGNMIVTLLFGKYELRVENTHLPSVSFERATLAQRDGLCRIHCAPLARN